MSDLISRSALIETISKMDFDFGNDTDDTQTIIEMVNQVIAEQSVAYDKEAVVEQLEENKKTATNCSSIFDTQAYVRLDKAIEIVKAGGIDG